MQPPLLLGEHHRGRPPRHTVLTRVHPLAETLACPLELREGPIGPSEVVIGRHQISLRDPNSRLRATFALWIRGHARRDRQPVMTANRDDLRVADRDPAHMITDTVRSLSVNA